MPSRPIAVDYLGGHPVVYQVTVGRWDDARRGLFTTRELAVDFVEAYHAHEKAERLDAYLRSLDTEHAEYYPEALDRPLRWKVDAGAGDWVYTSDPVHTEYWYTIVTLRLTAPPPARSRPR